MADYPMVVIEPGGPENFARREIACPEPGPGEVVVRHTAIGLNFLDVHHRSGLYRWPVSRGLVLGRPPGSRGPADRGADPADPTNRSITWA